MRQRKIALVGCGNLGKIIMTGILDGTVAGYTPVAVMDVSEAARNAMAEFAGCPACASLEEVLAHGPDIIVEATAPNPLKALALPILQAGVDLVSLSVGAYADDEFAAKAKAAAEESGAHIYLPSGAVGGFDVINAVKMMGGLHARIVNEKPPMSLNGAPMLQAASCLKLRRKNCSAAMPGKPFASSPTMSTWPWPWVLPPPAWMKLRWSSPAFPVWNSTATASNWKVFSAKQSSIFALLPLPTIPSPVRWLHGVSCPCSPVSRAICASSDPVYSASGIPEALFTEFSSIFFHRDFADTSSIYFLPLSLCNILFPC